MKLCPKCEQEKPLTEFYKNSNRKDGLSGYCKICQKERVKKWAKTSAGQKSQKDAATKYRTKSKYYMRENYRVRQRENHLRRTYGITGEQYEVLLQEQGGACAICLRPATDFKKRLAVDHDHRTHAIRGLLCDFCNRKLIGHHRDPDRFERAAAYLRRTPTLYAPAKRKRRKR